MSQPAGLDLRADPRDDLVEHGRQLGRRAVSKHGFGLPDIGNPSLNVVLERRIRHVPEWPVGTVSDPPFEHDVQRRVPDVRKAEVVLGYRATTELPAMLDEVVPWIRAELEAGRL